MHCTQRTLDGLSITIQDQEDITFGGEFVTDCHNKYTTMCTITFKYAAFVHDPTYLSEYFPDYFPPREPWFSNGCFWTDETDGKSNF